MKTEQEVAKVIEDFPRYEVTTFGRVFNRETGREMAQNQIQYGIVTVSLMQDVEIVIDGYTTHQSIQKSRSVKSLVAKAFVEGHSDVFDTPIQLDGNRENLHASNIMWRPRWFAIRYTRQMYNQEEWFFTIPIVDTTNDVIYDSIFDAATTMGLLCRDIKMSLHNDKPVFPYGTQFSYMNTT